MMDLHQLYKVEVSKDRLKAFLTQNSVKAEPVSESQLTDFLKECGVTAGIDPELLKEAAAKDLEQSVVIAAGKPPVKGNNAYLQTTFSENKSLAFNEKESVQVDFKEVIHIPMVEEEALVAEKIPAEPGLEGFGVDGEVISAPEGKDLKVRPGKNTYLSEDGLKLFASRAGQVSMDAKTVHVYAVYEINGDLDMKTGNISFNGNVVIRGNVPAGFTVKARGDIRIDGTVEAASLESEGSLYISQGVVAQGAGQIICKGEMKAGFLNEANVHVHGSLYVTKSILHSQVTVNGHIYCTQGKGNIVGGSVSSVQGIEVNEIGNRMHSPTAIYVGIHKHAKNAETEFTVQKKSSVDTLKKLKLLKKGLTAKRKHVRLSERETGLLKKIDSSIEETMLSYQKAVEELEQLEELESNVDYGEVHINKICYPYADFHFGKYRRKVLHQSEKLKLSLVNSEITLSPL